MIKEKDVCRFWRHVKKGDPEACWVWQSSVIRSGYGRFSLDRKTRSAHRVSWRIHHGEIPAGLCVLHKCDNPPCINPNHLFLGTLTDNNRDTLNKGRHRHALNSAKINMKTAREIRRLYDGGEHDCYKLGKIYGLHRVTIQRLVRGIIWKE